MSHGRDHKSDAPTGTGAASGSGGGGGRNRDAPLESLTGDALAWRCVECDDWETVLALLTSGSVHPNARTARWRNSLLHCAARARRVDVVRALGALRCDPNPRDKAGDTPLLWAARNGHLDVVTALVLQARADPNAPDAAGGTPLSWAARNGQVAVLRFLASPHARGGRADVDARDADGDTALICAARNGQFDAVTALIEHAADLSVCNAKGQSALTIAPDDTLTHRGRAQLMNAIADARKTPTAARSYAAKALRQLSAGAAAAAAGSSDACGVFAVREVVDAIVAYAVDAAADAEGDATPVTGADVKRAAVQFSASASAGAQHPKAAVANGAKPAAVVYAAGAAGADARAGAAATPAGAGAGMGVSPAHALAAWEQERRDAAFARAIAEQQLQERARSNARAPRYREATDEPRERFDFYD